MKAAAGAVRWREKPTPAPEGSLALYIHIPFCERKCLYCDFNSGAFGPASRRRYVEALEREIAVSDEPGRAAHSVFFGGGTPSVLPASDIARILNALRSRFHIAANAEITVECNPGTVDSERMAGEPTGAFLRGLQEAGVTRLSFGVQSFDAALLARLGRIHSPEQAIRSVAAAQDAGFPDINVDLMFALPTQTLAGWEDSLRRALALDVPHLSAYSLIVEPNTPFWAMHERHELPRPSEEEEADMYGLAIDLLTSAGLDHYEVSAFARPGHRSIHNITYWRNEEYLGFGNGAASYLGGERFTRDRNLHSWTGRAMAGEDTVLERERLDTADQMSETMIMGLRMASGVERSAFQRRFERDPVVEYGKVIWTLERNGLLWVSESAIGLTRRGFFVANDVWEAFLSSGR